jgi:hypothetical protein
MRAPAMFMVRLVAVAMTLAVAGGSGARSSAPHELRGWVDTIAELSQRQASLAPTRPFQVIRARAQVTSPRPDHHAAPAGRSVRAVVVAFQAALIESRLRDSDASGPWPGAGTGSQVIARKCARLI